MFFNNAIYGLFFNFPCNTYSPQMTALHLYGHSYLTKYFQIHHSTFHSLKVLSRFFYLHLTDKELMLSDMDSDLPQIPNNWYSQVSYPDLVNSKSEQFSIMLRYCHLNLFLHGTVPHLF